MPRTRSTFAVALCALLVAAGLIADAEDPAELLRQARKFDRERRQNQAYRQYQRIVQRHGKSAEAVEARYWVATYNWNRKHWWGTVRTLQSHVDKVEGDWKHKYGWLLGRALVEQNAQHPKKVELVRQALKTFTARKAGQASIDEARFYLARAIAGPWIYAGTDLASQQDEDRERIAMVDATYLRIVKDNADRGERAARARFERAVFWATHRHNLRGGLNWYGRPTTNKFSDAGAAYDKAFRTGLTKAFVQLQEIQRRFPGHWAGRATFARAYFQANFLLDLPKAVAIYRELAGTRDPLAINARAQIRRITQEEISGTRMRIVTPGTPIEFNYRVRNIKSIEARLFALPLDQIWDARFNDTNPTHAMTRWTDANRRQPVKTFTWTTGCKDDHIGVRSKLTVPVDARPGAYMLELRGQQRLSRQLIVVSNLAVTATPAHGETLVTVTDRETRKPVGDAAVTIVGYDRHKRRLGFWRGATGADGVVRIAREMSQRYHATIVARTATDQALMQQHNGWWGNWTPGQHRVFVDTDRPLYRPGHDVSLKVVVRKGSNDGYVNAAGAKLRVRVLDPRRNPVLDKHLVADENGSVDASLTLKKKATLGMYRVQVIVDGRNSHWYGHDNMGRFRVEEYRKPEFTVRVTPGKGDYVPGDEVEMTLKARYYHGAPVRMGTVGYQVYWTPYSPPSAPGFRLVEGSHGGRRGWQPTRVAVSGSGTTDEHGQMTIRFKTWSRKQITEEQKKQAEEAPPKKGDAKSGKAPRRPPFGRRGGRRGGRLMPASSRPVGDARFTVSAHVTDKSRRRIAGGGSITVTKTGIAAVISPPANLLRVGKAASFGVRITTPGGAPVSTRAHVTISRHDGKEFAERVATIAKFRTGADGNGRFSFTPDKAGTYQVKLTASDRRDNSVSTSVPVIASDVGSHDETLTRQWTSGLLPERPDYESGQTARFLLAQPKYEGPAYIIVSETNRILAHQTVMLKNGVAVFDQKLEDAWAPNVHVTAVLPAAGGRVTQHRRELRVTPAHKALNVTVEPNAETYRPGEQAEVGLRVTDADGKPVRTRMWLRAFDTRVLAIQPELTRHLMQHFYGDRRPYHLRTSSSYQFSANAHIQWTIDRPRLRGGTVPHQLKWRYSRWFNTLTRIDPWWRPDSKKDADPTKEGHQTADLRRGKLGDAAGGRAMGKGAPMDSDDAEMAAESSKKSRSSARNEAGAPRPAKSGQSAQVAEPKFKKAVIRKSFRDTAFWTPSVQTDADGRATVSFQWPDNLTRWRLIARAATPSTQVGQASKDVRTAKMLVVQLAAPRFFTERDEVVLSAVVNNQLREKRKAKLVLKLAENGPIAIKKTGGFQTERIVTLKPGKDYRMDWRVAVVGSGTASIEMQALTEVESDAVRRSFPVVRYGITKHEGDSGAMIGTGKQTAGDMKASLTLSVPEQRDVHSTRLKVVLSPSVAVAALEALPYLASYPYGCVEQTMSRFGPSVLVKRSLVRLGLPLEQITDGKAGRAIPSGTWGKPHFRKFTALRDAQLDRMIDAGLARLYAFQHGDGGWGWWKHDRTNRYMTTYVVDGLMTARACDVAIPQGRIDRGMALIERWLKGVNMARLEKDDEHRYDVGTRNRLTFQLYVWSRDYGRRSEKVRDDIGALIAQMADHADGLTPYARALLALAAKQSKQDALAGRLVADLAKSAKVDARAGHVNWAGGRGWWRWYNDPVETSAFALRALLRVAPDSDLIPGVVRYLTDARQGTRWHSTKTTAFAISALIEYLEKSGELEPDYTVDVLVNGKQIGSVRFDKANLLTAENVIEITGDAVKTGDQNIEFVKRGKGNLYYSAFVTYFSREDEIGAAGYRIAVRRSYTRIRKTAQGETREKLTSGARLVSGDLVEVELVLDSDREYRYACLEERKAACLEPELQVSGRGPGIATHMEMRDTMVVIFASRVPKGVSRIRYRLRAEAPGNFCALPLTGYLMYAPDIRANSKNFRLVVSDE